MNEKVSRLYPVFQYPEWLLQNKPSPFFYFFSSPQAQDGDCLLQYTWSNLETKHIVSVSLSVNYPGGATILAPLRIPKLKITQRFMFGHKIRDI